MVCARCEMAVKTELDKMEISFSSVKLGEVELQKELAEIQKKDFEKNLKQLGFELLDDKVSQIIEQIKNRIIELVYYSNEQPKVNLSTFLADDLHQDYSVLSKLFSENEAVTIEHYFIAQKIERVKELLVYDELTLSEIAYQLNYSNVAHLSNQFKKTIGITPTQFKKLKDKTRIQIDAL